MSRHVGRVLVVLLAAVGLLGTACTNAQQNTSGKFNGVTIRVVTFTGPRCKDEEDLGPVVACDAVPFSGVPQDENPQLAKDGQGKGVKPFASGVTS